LVNVNTIVPVYHLKYNTGLKRIAIVPFIFYNALTGLGLIKKR